MPRAERLLELQDLLGAGRMTTVPRLAQDLHVSDRTVLRDLAALRARGVPIVGRSGRQGGVGLANERGVTAVHLALPEIVALWLAARLSREASHLPWGEAAAAGMTKLLGSLPEAKARALGALARRVVVGEPASARTRAEAGAPPAELLRLFEEAFTAGLGLGFQYTDRHGSASARRVEPHGLGVTSPVWYILARDLDRNAPRAFRMDRIARPRILRDVVFRPDLGVIRAQLPLGGRGATLTGRWTE